jgi:hypothetical protein
MYCEAPGANESPLISGYLMLKCASAKDASTKADVKICVSILGRLI